MLTGKDLNLDQFELDFYYNSLAKNKTYANIHLNDLLLLKVSNELIEFFKQMTFEENEFSTSEMSIQATLNLKNHLFFNNIDWTKLENGELQAPFVPDRV